MFSFCRVKENYCYYDDDRCNYKETTFLMEASREGHVDLMKVLLKNNGMIKDTMITK